MIDEKRRQEYTEYVNSKTWKRIKNAAIERAQFRCQKCGVSKWSVALEVHHLTYERFKHERAEDLQVLCPECHKLADGVRVKETQSRNHAILEDARLDGWATKVYGKDWEDRIDPEEAHERFSAWRESREA